MIQFSKQISIRWADLDPNFHMRHSAYYDFGAQLRIEVLDQLGLTTQLMQEQGFGPILFREECVFRKEIRFADPIIIDIKMAKLRPDASRWTIRHQFLSPEGKLHAVITIDGAWLDTKLRKLASSIPQEAVEAFHAFPRTEDFVTSS